MIASTLISVFLCAGAAMAQPAVEITSEVHPERATRFDKIELSVAVIVAGNEEPTITSEPDLSDFELISSGKYKRTQTLNGQPAVRYLFVWRLRPSRAGILEIGNVRFRVGNQNFDSEAVQVEVADTTTSIPRRPPTKLNTPTRPSTPTTGSSLTVPAEVAKPGEDYFVSIETNKTEVWLGEPFYVDYDLYRPELPPDLYDVRDPDFTAFWPHEKITDSYRYRSVEKAGRKYAVENVRDYVLVPLEVGALEVSGVKVHVPLAAGFGGDRTWIASPSAPVMVKSLPPNAPPGFDISNVGHELLLGTTYRVTGAAGPEKLRVGDSFVLSIDLQGEGLVDQMKMPAPASDAFAIFGPELEETSLDVQGESVVGSQRLTVTYIPTREGQIEVPAIEWPWFDYATGEYKVMKAGPWMLTVSGKAPNADTFLAHTAQQERMDLDEDAQVLGASAREVRSEGWTRGEALYGRWWFLLLMVLPPVGFVGLMGGEWWRRRRSDGAVARRTDNAHKQAKKKLRAAAKAQDTKTGLAELATGLQMYLKNAFDVSAKALTGDRLVTALVKAGAKRKTATQVAALLQKAQDARYAPSAADTDIGATTQDALALLGDLESQRGGAS